MQENHAENDPTVRSSSDCSGSDSWRVTIPSPEQRSMRVEIIRREIAEGSYEVPGEAVADAMLEFFSRGT